MNPLERHQKTNDILRRLADGGPSLSLQACRELVDVGYSPRVAWAFVEAILEPSPTPEPETKR